MRVSIPSRGSGKGDFNSVIGLFNILGVSIPSRGSGKGDTFCNSCTILDLQFQSPLGEVVKETTIGCLPELSEAFQSPLGEVVKETIRPGSLTQKGFQASNLRTFFYLSIRP